MSQRIALHTALAMLVESCALPSVDPWEPPQQSSNAAVHDGGAARSSATSAKDAGISGGSGGNGGSKVETAGSGGELNAATSALAGRTGGTGTQSPGIATLGLSCSWPDARACIRRDSPDLLRCDGSQWVSAGKCQDDGSSCYIWAGPIAGTCQFEADACDEAQLGKLVCAGQNIHRCDDQVKGASTREETCAGDTPDCEAAQCVCKSRCGDQCVSLQWDDKHCGTCDRDCGGNHCAEGKCQPLQLVNGRVDPQVEIAVDDSYVYWADLPAKKLMRTPHQGGESVALAEVSNTQSVSFFSDGTDFYWADWAAGTISKQPRTGGQITVLARDQAWAVSLTGDATHVYWVGGENPRSAQKLAKSGGQITSLFNDTRPEYLVLDGQNIYYANNYQMEVVHQSLDTMQRTNLVTGTDLVPIGVQGGQLYYEHSWKAVARIAALGGGARAELVSEARVLRARIDATHMYWLAEAGVMRQDLAQNEAAEMVVQGSFSQLTLDERWLFLANGDTIVRVAKQ